ncbi:SDR family NAD(P)-dependent oxidoreductase [Pseudonocardia sp. RS010]|uniref:SDR family NAD(P)-dependent oxidoreductase n=1 Tax=Pseudonocardia sp. RS010 TaxID=3385979 RepID=UPI0039A1F29C
MSMLDHAVPAARDLAVTGRSVIITGAGQGIGAEYARHFAAAGARCTVVDVDPDTARAVADQITDAGGTAFAQAVDITDPTGTEELARTVVERFGRVDALINNAAIFAGLTLRGLEEIPLDEWDRVLQVNVTGTYLPTRAVAPYMRAAGTGRIVNVGSAAVPQGLVDCLHYVTSKSAIVGMTYSMARELGPHGITVNAIQPGGTRTEVARKTQTDEGRALMLARQCIKRHEVPADLVGLALFLCSDASAFLTGQVIACDGGSTHR